MSYQNETFRRWNEVLVEAIQCRDSYELLELIVKAIYTVADIDSISVMIYSKLEKPVCLFDNIKPSSFRGSITNYINGPYQDNPFYSVAVKQPVSGLYTLRQIASEEFWQSEHYNKFYKDTNMMDELDFLFPIDRDSTFVISMGRDFHHEMFSSIDTKGLKATEPVIRLLVSKYIAATKEPNAVELETPDNYSTLQVAIDREYEGVLTGREREVVFLILNGCSVKESARLLDISPGTIKAHKKSIYSKLGISTQGDLFSLFVTTLSSKP